MNRLAEETSPYLRQHADNPVDWWPWGAEAFAEAARRDVPLLLSVGYSACHSCHVMAHESFEDEATAAVVNELFVSVKVDREERPDVDAVYMEAVQAVSGSGGWPMTVWCTPDGRPFLAGTYFPKQRAHGRPSFLEVCRAVAAAWQEKRPELEQQADQLRDAVVERSSSEYLAVRVPEGGSEAEAVVEAALAGMLGAFDPEWGGFGKAPKFPQPAGLELALRGAAAAPGGPLEAAVRTTLAAMASGGIYDHLGGGFARYATDRRWLVPHFEKMLYDQAGLLRAYLHAWQLFGDPGWRQVCEEVVAYVERDLAQPEGGISSAEDADSEGVEGRFYVWAHDELRQVGGEAAVSWYGASPEGNWEGPRGPAERETEGPSGPAEREAQGPSGPAEREAQGPSGPAEREAQGPSGPAEREAQGTNILWRPVRGDLQRPPEVEAARVRLLDHRSRRARPGLDDKVVTEWNGMWAGALAEAGSVLGRPDWVASAERVLSFLHDRLRRPDGRWLRSWQREGGARHLAVANDVAWVVEACTRLAEATGSAAWLARATEAAAQLLDRYEDADAGGVFTVASDGEQLIARQKDTYDGATPSANSVAAAALLRVGALTGEDRWTAAGNRVLDSLGPLLAVAPTAATGAVAALASVIEGPTEVVITGDRPDLVAAALCPYRPDRVVAWGERYPGPLWEGRDQDGVAYVCRGYACERPVSTPEQLAAVL